MPILKLVAEHIGPFERLELDLSDGKGHPHPGPHILAGVNGSGKSTVLKTIAALMDHRSPSGFDWDQFKHLTAGDSCAGCSLEDGPILNGIVFVSEGSASGWLKANFGLTVEVRPGPFIPAEIREMGFRWCQAESPRREVFAGAYAPTRTLRHIARVDLSQADTASDDSALAFEASVRNEVIQAWLVGLFSRKAIAAQKKESSARYDDAIERFERALSAIYGQRVAIDVDARGFIPQLRMFSQTLNFSQLPDGVKSTIAWIGDFMMRQDEAVPGSERPSLLLLDEIETHLHPLWQRRLLPAMRSALPGVQIIASSHSPFTISSCAGARIHVLDLDDKGRARLRESVDAPVGESVTAILKDIFGVDSRFDIDTERELNDWNEYAKLKAIGQLKPKQKKEFAALTKRLAGRSEELRAIVGNGIG